MDDLARLLARREGFARPDRSRPGTGSPAFLGKVVSSGSNIAAGKFLLVNPVVVLGAEVEGGAGTLAADAAIEIPVYLVRGTPATGDLLPCRFVDHRWVAEKRGPGGPTPIVVNIPGCVCQGTPASLACVVSYGPGEDASTYQDAYQSCTLQYYDYNSISNPSGSIPSYLPTAAFTGAGYYSTTSWIDGYGFEDYFKLNCYVTQYALGFGQGANGSWQSPGQIYLWNVGGDPAVNFCDPFGLLQGHPQDNVVFHGKIVITG